MTGSDTDTIVRAIVAEGVYELCSPAHFGGGETDDTDMALLRHASDSASSGKPFIPGSSIAGAARAALDARLRGWAARRAKPNQEDPILQQLFGNNTNDWDCQSAIIVSDAELVDDATPATLLRDGVAIDSKRGTALPNHKYDMEALPCGNRFTLRLELVERKGHNVDLRAAFYSLLHEFTDEAWPVRLGGRVNRGYGNGRVREWKVREARFDTPSDTLADDVAWWLTDRVPTQTHTFKSADLLSDKRQWLWLNAQFAVKSSVLVRSYSKNPKDPDMVPVRGQIAEDAVAVVPGTALAGVCRQRALRITRTLAPSNAARADALIFALFGPDPEEHKQRSRTQKSKHTGGAGNNHGTLDSRVIFDEAVLLGGSEEVQSRIHIDPLTGGVHQGPFDEQAVWSGESPTTLTLNIRVRDPQAAECGLMLTMLKDLWLEDLPVGGGASIGRGVLRGEEAHIQLRQTGQKQHYTFKRSDEGSAISGLNKEEAQELNDFATALTTLLKK